MNVRGGVGANEEVRKEKLGLQKLNSRQIERSVHTTEARTMRLSLSCKTAFHGRRMRAIRGWEVSDRGVGEPGSGARDDGR